MVKFSAFDKFNIDKNTLLFLHLWVHLPLSLSFQNHAVHRRLLLPENVSYSSVLPMHLKLFCTYTSFCFTMFFIFVEFLVIVYFVLLKHCLHHVKNYVLVMNMIYASTWIRISQCIHVYDVKSCFAHGWHGVGVEEGNSLKREKATIFCLGSNSLSWTLCLALLFNESIYQVNLLGIWESETVSQMRNISYLIHELL